MLPPMGAMGGATGPPVARTSATYDISCHGATSDGGIAITLEHVGDVAAPDCQVPDPYMSLFR